MPELDPSHGVDYSFDIWQDGYPKDGYVGDFCQLLFAYVTAAVQAHFARQTMPSLLPEA